MEAIIAFVTSKLGIFAAGLSAPLLFVFARKQAKNLVSNFVGGKLKDLLNPDTGDAQEKELIRAAVLALVKLAEHKIPGEGMGKAKYEAVAGKLCAMIPAIASQKDRIAELIETAVLQMKAELANAQADA